MTSSARLVVLSGPSGVGKSSVVDRIRSGYPDVHMSVSVTTRAPRPGEIDGVHYRFISRDDFERMIDDGHLLEWAEFAGNLYGTPAAPVAESVAQAYDVPSEPTPAAILDDQVVWVTTPVRIDFSGGWSDTPPISTELGGNVLNAAITLNGQYPVQVMAKLNHDGVIRLASIDLGQRVTIRTTAELLNHDNPQHWAALPKAALVLAGIGPSRRGESLKTWLGILGGGLDLTIFSALPKGSGMGTSSILGAAVLACLDRRRRRQ